MFPNPLYVLCPSLQDIFIDKDNGQLLADGNVTFYRDVNRTELKPIFKIAGSPPNYSFVQLDNPLTLSSIGTYVDNVVNNNQITVYLYPYDEDGNVDLYYIRVNNSLGVFQFDKPAWPPSTFEEIDINGQEVVNFIPNGQFLNNFNIALNKTNPITELNKLNNGINIIAPGGFTIERGLSSTSQDNFNFERIGSYTAIPTGSPRYLLNFNCVSADPSDFKIIGVKFLDVNKFASDVQQYNFYTEVSTNTSNFTAQIYLIKYFGSGGSPTELVPIDSINVTNNTTKINITVLFSTNTDESVGPNDDDYVQLAIVLPNIPLNFRCTNFSLTQGEAILEEFPVETNADMTSRGIAGWLDRPKSDGSTLYLPIVETQQGLAADDSTIGNIIFDSTGRNLTLTTNALLCDGRGNFPVNGYSNLGIPYSRLFNKILVVGSPTYAGPLFGTGSNFVTSYLLSSASDTIKIVNNLSGPTLGTGQPGSVFTIRSICVGQNLGDSLYSGITSGQSGIGIIGIGKYINTVNNISPGTAGFTVSQVYNDTLLTQLFTIIASNSPALAGLYFPFSSRNSAGGLDNYYIWFTVNGVGVDPSPGGTGILINLLSIYNNIDLNYLIKDALLGYKIVTIQFPAASIIPTGYYINFYANSVLYTLWFNINNGGGAPSGDNLIEVKLSSTNTAAQVAQITSLTINSQFYNVPDLGGKFLRFQNLIGDAFDSGLRANLKVTDAAIANITGSYQHFAVQQHNHSGSVTIPTNITFFPQTINGSFPTNNLLTNAITNQSFPLAINSTGFTQTYPENFAAVPYIRY